MLSAMSADTPRTAAELGLMRGSPPPPDKRVTFWNWETPPFNRWSFQHVAACVPTARVWRGDGPVSRFERRPVRLDDLTLETVAGGQVTVADVLRRTCTDGFLVLHEGCIVAEEYFNGMTPAGRHLLMSVSKSIIGMLAGIVIGRGALSADDLVTDVVTELRGTSFEQATVRHLLDMRTGTRFSEDYDDPQSDVCRSERVADWAPLLPGEESSGLYGYVPSLGNARDHGGAFEYRSILTDVLGWVLARAAGESLPELLSSALWAPLGAEEDADMTVDRHGCPWVDGGICVTLRDLARLGQMHLQDGWLNGRQIVPAEWVRDTRVGGADSRAAFAASAWGAALPAAFYRNQFWVIRPEDGVYAGWGIHGQFLYVDVPARVVIAELSTLPRALDREVWADQVAALDAIAAAL
jgi:CubicO group peptidase (beta-lactamase class C family)